MLISVIIPVYNIEQYIEECIESVLRQDYKELEIILVDDGSTDSSSQICDRYALSDPRIKVFHIENSGLSGARNFGTKAATGEFVYYLDGDDCFTEGAISSSAEKIQGEVDAVIAKCANYYTEDGAIKPEKIELKDEYVAGLDGEAAFASLMDKVDRSLWSAWRPLFRRSLMLDNDLWFRSRLLSEDLDLMPHIYRKARAIAVNNRVNTLYRVNRPGSIMTTANAKRYLDIYDIMTRWLEFIDDKSNCSEEFGNAMRRQIEMLYYNYFRKLRFLSNKDRAIVCKEAKKLSFLLDSKHIPSKFRRLYRILGFNFLNLLLKITKR